MARKPIDGTKIAGKFWLMQVSTLKSISIVTGKDSGNSTLTTKHCVTAFAITSANVTRMGRTYEHRPASPDIFGKQRMVYAAALYRNGQAGLRRRIHRP